MKMKEKNKGNLKRKPKAGFIEINKIDIFLIRLIEKKRENN